MDSIFLPHEKATVRKDDLTVIFYRLHRDTRDIMCDSPKPEWTAVDEFMIELRKLETYTYWDRPRFAPKDADPIQRTSTRCVDEYSIRTTSRKAANYIWYLAEKVGMTYDQLVEMDKADKFAM